jgi:nucleotide-binding universal stress UspA family protein
MTEPSSIVVGVDFSECSRAALVHALRIASWSRAALHAVHVVETNRIDRVEDEAQLTWLPREIHARHVQDARNRWAAFSEATTGARDLPFDVCVGSIMAGIRQQLIRDRADLLVLGAYGATKPNVGIGTVASGCIRAVPVDVLLVRDNHTEPFQTVAVGIDFSDESRRALESAARLAHHDGAKLQAVYVAEDDPGMPARLCSDLELLLRSFVTAVTDRCPGLDVACNVYAQSGHRSGILEFASLVNADLIAIGKKGRTNLREVLLGSTAEKVLRDSAIAVLAAKSRPAHAELA